MFRKVEEILNVGAFQTDGRLLVYTNNVLVSKRTLYVNGEPVNDFSVAGFYLGKGYVLAASWEPSLYLIERGAVNLLCSGYSLSQVPVGPEKFIISRQNDDNSFSSFIYDLNKRSIVEQLPDGLHGWKTFGSNYGFIRTSNEIIAIELKNKNKLWVKNISDVGSHTNKWGEKTEGKVTKIIGIHNDILWVGITNNTLMGFQTFDGSVRFHLRDISGFEPKGLPSAIPNTYSMQLDHVRNKIIGFQWEFYWEVDCESGKISLTDMTNSFQKEEIRGEVPDFAYDGNYIYFLQHTPGKLGVFDTTKKMLVWQYALGQTSKDEGVPKEITLSGDQLYVLDTNGKLQVFERE